MRSAIRWILSGSLLLAVGLALAAPAAAPDSAAGNLKLYTCSRVEKPAGSGQFEIVYKTVSWDPKKTALIVCDMWDQHWCKGAAAREAEMAPRCNDFVAKARKRGVLIVHAPSECMAAYKDHPARRRAQNAPKANVPDFLKGECHGLPSEKAAKWPIDQSDEGCNCTPPCKLGQPWRRQIDVIKIADEDAISDSGVEIGNLFVQRGIENVILVGVHENMCVISRPFGLRNMVRFGKNVLLVRDLTDTMYNSRMPPRVSHIRGTELVREHIEKYVCPTITSSDLLGGPAFRFKEDTRPHVAFVAAEDEYHTGETIPAFAQMLREKYGCYCTVSLGQGPEGADIPHLDELKTADAAAFYIRRRALPKGELDKIRAYLNAGKPLVAMRTCSHAFVLEEPDQVPAGTEQWPAFDHEVLGDSYHGHIQEGGATIKIAPDAVANPILAGVAPAPWTTNGTLYHVMPLEKTAKVLLLGTAQETTEPVAWTRAYKGGRVFYTELGHPDDFKTPQFRTLLLNAIFWAMDRPVPAAR